MTIAAPPAAASPAGEPDHPTDTTATATYSWNLSGPKEMPVLPPTMGARIVSADTTQVLPPASDVAANPARTRVPYGEYRGTPAPALKPGYLTDEVDKPHPLDGARQLIDAAQNSGPLPDWALGLEDWWVWAATQDIENSIHKIVEYGGRGAAYDLIATGHDLAAMNGRRVGDEEAVELAILMYLSSKVNRWFAAAIDGRRPSDDTLLDIAYYAMMARRNRAVGGWPVAPDNTEEKHA
jgi:hypothetical protein